MGERVTRERIEEWKALADKATPGPWTFGVYKRHEPRQGSLVAAVAPGHQILAGSGGATYPANDGELVAASRTALPAMAREIERLNEAMEKALPLLAGADSRPVERAAAILRSALTPATEDPDA
jgi:hypothetical protein